jgi:F0F1-type ATP synthase assembly protein I
MSSTSSHGGDLSQALVMTSTHRTDVPANDRAADPAAAKGKSLYQGLSASSVGLELGIAVTLGVFGGLWIDDELSTSPLFLLVFIGFGLVAGFKGVMRAVAREDRRAAATATATTTTPKQGSRRG